MMPEVVTADAPAGIPQLYNDTEIGLSSRVEVNRDKTRWVISLGDHIEQADKPGFKSIGAHFGGLWVGHSETEGCPNLKRTNYMLYRGALSPVETTAIPRKADHREVDKQNESFLVGKDVPPGTRGYTVYAGDGLAFLQNDRFRPMGVVEVDALRFKTWGESNARALQLMLFPRWDQWLQGIKAPVLLQDWLTELNESFNNIPELAEMFKENVFESARLFRNYALRHIEQNRQNILSKRNVDSGGFFTGWNGISRLYAAQIGQQLEQENELRPTQGTQSLGDSALIQEMRAERKLRSQEMAQQRDMMQMLVELVKEKVGDSPIGEYAQEFIQDAPVTAPDLEFVQQVEEEYDPALHAPQVSFGADYEEVTVTEPAPAGPVDPENNPVRDELNEKLEDPEFALAVDTDPGLRGAIKENPALKGAIDEE